MNKIQDKVTAFWRDVVNLVLGIWLIISPFALGYTAQTTSAWNAYAVGVVIAVLSAAAIWQFQKWEEWLRIGFESHEARAMRRTRSMTDAA